MSDQSVEVLLTVEHAGQPSRQVTITHLPALIGRSSSSALRLDDPKVSAVHAKLDWGQSGLELVDLDSRNGTFVSGKRIPRATLSKGDKIVLGDTTVTLADLRKENAPAGHQKKQRRSRPEVWASQRDTRLVLAVGSVIALLVVLSFLAVTSPFTLTTNSSSVASGPPEVPEPEEVAQIAQEDMNERLASIPPSSTLTSDTIVTSDMLFDEIARGAEIKVVDERVYEYDDSLVILTLEMTWPDDPSEDPLRWDVCYQRYPGGAEPTQIPYLTQDFITRASESSSSR